MLLSQLLAGYMPIAKDLDRSISGLSLDSRTVNPGEVFFAWKGYQDDGRKYVEQAIMRGATAVITEVADNSTVISAGHEKAVDGHQAVLISLPGLREKLGLLAARFYGDPSQDLYVIGVTGTNGKTSCCLFLAEAFQMAGKKTGIIGTLGNGIYGKLQDSALTMPDPITLQRLLAEMRSNGVDYVMMEASSQGLDQQRHQGVAYDLALFTNLTREHLDYHGDMATYKAAKEKLFQVPTLAYSVINIDDKFGRELASKIHGRMPVYGYSAEGRLPDFSMPMVRSHQVKMSATGINASVHTPWGEGVIHTKLLGRFNLSNLLAVLAILGIREVPLQEALDYVARLQGVPGRMEFFGGQDQPFVVVDFAHTPDALTQVLVALREYCQGDLWCVFGCGGNRDPGKRPIMGRCAETYADHVVITDDNPRHEDPQTIVAEILKGMREPKAAVVEHDRKRAINHAISCAHPGDVVLVAGKGHEKYQIVGDEKLPFNDQLVVQMALAETNL